MNYDFIDGWIIKFQTNLYNHAVSEQDRRRENPINATRSNSDDPGGGIRHRSPSGARVSSAARHHDVPFQGMQWSNGDAVLDVGRASLLPDGNANHVDSVRDGIVEGSQHVVIQTRVPFRFCLPWNRPADFVDGQADEGGAASGVAVSETPNCGGIGYYPATDGWRGVGTVTVDVSGWSEVLGRVEGPEIGLVTPQIVAGTYEFPVEFQIKI